jgi:predicted nucleotidyltransferase
MAGKSRYGIRIAQQFVRVLRKNKIRVTRAYLFGSYASGNPASDSDVDIVVVSSQFDGDPLDHELRLMRLRRNVDLRISPFAYHPRDFKKDYVIPCEAMTNGIRIA